MSRANALARPASGKTKLKDLLLKKENSVCADCGAPDPKWASANIGVFICLKCCGAHRSLGTHVSKVLSVTLDEWSDEEIDNMIEVGGNSTANSIYEASIREGVSKPKPTASHDERLKFISDDFTLEIYTATKTQVHDTFLQLSKKRSYNLQNVNVSWSKYEFQEFLKPSLRIMSISSGKNSLQQSFSKKMVDSFRSSSNASHFTEGMVEFIGLMKIKVIKGTNLAVRDVRSSDPYVILKIGKQVAKTSVANSNLNPVWNEELMLSVPQDYGAIKLEVYDHDTFSADDIMGEAEIDIQPLVTSAMAFGDPEMYENMQIGKWLKSQDNALMEDSIVNIVDGKVKQEVSLKLQNVESGAIFLELEWMPLDQ